MKIIILSALLLFLLACHSQPNETTNLTKSNTTPKDYTSDSIAKWTRNIKSSPTFPSDTVNFTDANNLKQGKWIIFTGKEVKTQYYKDGKLLEDC